MDSRRSRMSPASQILTTLLTHTFVYKSTYHAKPCSIYFLPQYISAEFTVIRVLHHKLQYSTGKSEKSESHRDSDGRGCKSHLGLGFFRLRMGSISNWFHIYHSHICSFGEKWESRKKFLDAKMLPSKNYEQGKHLTQMCYIFVLLQFVFPSCFGTSWIWLCEICYRDFWDICYSC